MNAKEQHLALIQYLQAKLIARDWHGVRDAAVDLEVLEARFPELKEMNVLA